MAYRVRVFLDFWNFQLTWNRRAPGQGQCNWPKLPAVFIAEARKALSKAAITEPLQLEETRVYGSYNPASSKDANLRKWLNDVIDRQPSFRVFARERVTVRRALHCRGCGEEIANCPSCARPFTSAIEKGVDTAIVTDLLSLAWEGAYEVGILVTSDADLIPCVERVQEKGFKIINAAWSSVGNQLAQACWASFLIDRVARELVRGELLS